MSTKQRSLTTMHLHGYMVKVTLTDDTLTAEGTNKASRIALAGENHGAGPVVMRRDFIASVDWKPAHRLTNGRVTVHMQSGDVYQMHFRRKDAELWRSLYETLDQS